MLRPKRQQGTNAVELCTDVSSLVQIIETENMMDRIVNGLSESSIKVRLAAVRWACPLRAEPLCATVCAVPARTPAACLRGTLNSVLLSGALLGDRGRSPGLVQGFLLAVPGCSQLSNPCGAAGCVQQCPWGCACLTGKLSLPFQMFAQFVPVCPAAQDKFSGSCCMEAFNEGKWWTVRSQCLQCSGPFKEHRCLLGWLALL